MLFRSIVGRSGRRGQSEGPYSGYQREVDEKRKGTRQYSRPASPRNSPIPQRPRQGSVLADTAGAAEDQRRKAPKISVELFVNRPKADAMQGTRKTCVENICFGLRRMQRR